jgi:hypothetical protein
MAATPRRRAWLLALAGLAAPWARAADSTVEGMAFAARVQLGGQTLQLNGVGVGQQLIEKVHVSALYLSRRSSDAAAVIDGGGPKRLETVFLRRVSAKALTRFFVNGMRQSAQTRALMQHLGDVARFGELFDRSGERAAGDRVTMDWLPGSGTEVRVNGRLLSPVIETEAIYKLLLDLYIGAGANRRLREGLLAGSAPGTP